MKYLAVNQIHEQRQVLDAEDLLLADYKRTCYTSLFYYGQDIEAHVQTESAESPMGSAAGYTGPVYGHHFFIDFDGDNPREIASALVPLLNTMENQSIKYYLFFSGRKGFHLYVPRQHVIFKEEYANKFHLLCRAFARAIMDEYPPLTPYIDEGIYDNVRMISFPFAPHRTTGKPKQPIKFLFGSNDPMPFASAEVDEEQMLKDLFLGVHIEDAEPLIDISSARVGQYKEPTPPDSDPRQLEELSVMAANHKRCMYNILTATNIEGQRHVCALRIVDYAEKQGYSPEDTAKIVNAWNAQLDKSMKTSEVSNLCNSYGKYDWGCNDKTLSNFCEVDCKLNKNNAVTEGVTESRQFRDTAVTAQRHTRDNPRHSVTLSMESLREWIDVCATGRFDTRGLYYEFNAFSEADKNKVRKYLSRLVQDGVIEPTGSRAGEYRKIQGGLRPMRLDTPVGDPLDLRWVFDIQRAVHVYPGNIVVVAGEPNSGKTAFLLNFVRMNMDRFDIKYFSSEMTDEEMALRLKMFGDDVDWTFDAFERSGDFADVIFPNAVNVIDFLETHEDFWRVGGTFREIHDKLDHGIAVIALQKQVNRGKIRRDTGKGGDVTLEKPRLYLAMTPHECKIVKAKNINPALPNDQKLGVHNATINFRIVNNGTTFIADTGWSYEMPSGWQAG